MNRIRAASYVLVLGVALYLVGILLPYAYFHVPAGSLPTTGEVKALVFGGPGAPWNAATPLVLMLVVSLAAFALLWPLGRHFSVALPRGSGPSFCCSSWDGSSRP